MVCAVRLILGHACHDLEHAPARRRAPGGRSGLGPDYLVRISLRFRVMRRR
jgi:hypothetical protein